MVIGVLRDDLQFPAGAQVWVPLSRSGSSEEGRHLRVLARLADGAESFDRAAQEVAAIALESSDSEPGARLEVRGLQERLNADSSSRRVFLGMLAVVTCLLLVAAFNVTNLLLCRAVERQRDIAVRVALGAGRVRIAAMHLTEAAVIAVVGGALGVALATRAIDGFRWGAMGRLEWWMDVRVDPPMLAFALGLVAFATVIAGVAPAIQATRGDPANGLHGAVHGGGSFTLSWLSERLVVLQVMMSAALLVQATQISATFADVGAWSSPNIPVEGEVLVAGHAFREGELRAPGQRLDFHRRLLDEVLDRGAVRGAGVMYPFPGQAGPESWVVPASYPDIPRYDRNGTSIVRMSPGALDVLGVSPIRGRDLSWNDARDGSAVLVNEAYVARFFPDTDPIGERVRFIPPGDDEALTAPVVGVVPQLGLSEFFGSQPSAIYAPLAAGQLVEAHLIVRAAEGREPLEHAAGLRAAMDAIDPEKPLYSVGSLESLRRREMAMPVAIGGLFVLTGFAGILMSGVGLYAVMAFAVGRRTYEIGVRAALGASRVRVLAAVLGRACLLLAQGMFLGLLLAAGMGDRLLFVERDPVVFGAVAVGLLAVGFVAAAAPSRRALRVEPAVSLRAE